jgi:hypothetical protein
MIISESVDPASVLTSSPPVDKGEAKGKINDKGKINMRHAREKSPPCILDCLRRSLIKEVN